MPATLRVSPAEFGSWKKYLDIAICILTFAVAVVAGHHQAGKDRPSRKFHNNRENCGFQLPDKSQVQGHTAPTLCASAYHLASQFR